MKYNAVEMARELVASWKRTARPTDMASGETEIQKFVKGRENQRQGKAIPSFMAHKQIENANVFFGTRYTERGKIYVGKPQDVDGHVLALGGAGSGKSSCIVIPSMGTWGGTFFAIDIKGELSRNQHVVTESKYPTKTFSFSEDNDFCRYDPFYLLRKGDQNDLVQNAREIAQAIIPILPDNREPFWATAAQHVLTAVLLYTISLKGQRGGSGVDKASFNHAMTFIQSKPIWDVIKEIAKDGDEKAKMFINQFKGITVPEDSKMLDGISAELSNRIMVFATDNRIKSAFTPSDNMLRWEDLEDHNIFMSIPEDKLGQWDGAITLMLTQLIRTLERRPDKYDNTAKKLPPVLLLLDEFPRLGKMDVIQNAVSTLRSKGVTICLIMQSLAQLDKTYGKQARQVIIDNCPYKAILGVTDPENQKIISDMIGSTLVSRESGSFGMSSSTGKSSGSNNPERTHDAFRSPDPMSNKSTSIKTTSQSSSDSTNSSISLSLTREPIIFPHELSTLKDILLITPEGFCRVDKSPYYNSITTTSKPSDEGNSKESRAVYIPRM